MERVNDFFSIDESAWPVVVLRYHDAPTPRDLEESLDRILAMYDRDGKRAVIVEAGDRVVLPAPMRRRQAEWMKANQAVMSEKCVGLAFVLRSRLLRGALTAIFWIQPPPAPHTVVETPSEAEAWCRAQLAARG